MALSEKQKRFADEYLKTLNATDAYRKAGYKAHKNETAYAVASRMLRNAKVADYIAERLESHKNDDFMDQKEVLEQLTSIARGDTQTTIFKRVNQDSGEVEFNNVTDLTPEIPDRLSALQMLGKYHKLFVDKAEVELTTPEIIDDVPEDDDDD